MRPIGVGHSWSTCMRVSFRGSNDREGNIEHAGEIAESGLDLDVGLLVVGEDGDGRRLAVLGDVGLVQLRNLVAAPVEDGEVLVGARAAARESAPLASVPLPDDVAIYIAGKIKSNIRELEGSLIRLIAYASLTGQEISLPLAQEVLKNILDHEDRAVTIEIIQKYVADYYNLKLVELKSRNNSKSVAMPRQIAMYLCKNLTHASLPEIGRSFGGKHHSTVIHSIRKVDDLRKKDADFNTQIDNFIEGFR